MERSKHLRFVEDLDFGKCHKTKFFVVASKFDYTILGEIKWYARWRQYCFFPMGDCVWSLDCLEDLTSFIHDLTRQKRLTLIKEKICTCERRLELGKKGICFNCGGKL